MTQQEVTDCFEYRDGCLYWKGAYAVYQQHDVV